MHDVIVPINSRHDALSDCRLETLRARLHGADRVTNGNKHTSTRISKSVSATVAHIVVSAHQHTLPTNRRIRYPHDAAIEQVTATVHVVELRLRHVTIHINEGERQLVHVDSLFQLEDTCGRFLNDGPGVVLLQCPRCCGCSCCCCGCCCSCCFCCCCCCCCHFCK